MKPFIELFEWRFPPILRDSNVKSENYIAREKSQWFGAWWINYDQMEIGD